MADVSAVIPIGPGHEAVADKAIASVQAQTIPVDIVTVRDEHRLGPGWARNEGLRRVQTTFVVFLDADDWIEPEFVERCLAAWKPNRYVFTDWYDGEGVKRAPCVNAGNTA